LVYPKDLQPIILQFAKSPKAQFFSDIHIAQYFYKDKLSEEEFFLNSLEEGTKFLFKNTEYLLIEKIKKRYLCKNLVTNRRCLFNPLASVIKI
jgi:hypothetical protein